MSSPSQRVEYKNETEIANVPVTDVRAAAAVAATTEQPVSMALVTRFINEIRFFSKTPGKLAPQGKALAEDSRAERFQPLHKFDSPKVHLVDQARDLAVVFLSTDGVRANAEAFLGFLTEKIPNKKDREEILQEIATLSRKGETDLVQYYDMVSRQQFVIEPGGDGLLHRRVPKMAGSSLYWDQAKYDTTTSSVALHGRPSGVAIWVQGPSGRFYSSTKSETGKFHHSSFLAGRDVKAAGDWRVRDGRLELISAMSGHYEPPLETLQGAVRDLARTTKALISAAKVQAVVKASDNDVEIDALEFCMWNEEQLSKHQACHF